MNLKEKRKLAQKGKKLNPPDIELLAIKKLGKKDYIRLLRDHFDCSAMTIHNAFNGYANSNLFEINKYLKSIVEVVPCK